MPRPLRETSFTPTRRLLWEGREGGKEAGREEGREEVQARGKERRRETRMEVSDGETRRTAGKETGKEGSELALGGFHQPSPTLPD